MSEELGRDAMQYDELIRTVSSRAGIPSEQAERATRATLQTLAERISEGDASDLASQLPEDLEDALRVGTNEQRFDLREFSRRVSDREGVTASEAERHAGAVLATLRDAITEQRVASLMGQLPEEFHELLARGDEPPDLSDELLSEQGRDSTGEWSKGRRGDDLGPPLVPPEER